MICLQRTESAIGDVEAEALGRCELQVAEFLEAFGFDRLSEWRRRPSRVKADLLVSAFDSLATQDSARRSKGACNSTPRVWQ